MTVKVDVASWLGSWRGGHECMRDPDVQWNKDDDTNLWNELLRTDSLFDDFGLIDMLLSTTNVGNLIIVIEH